MFLVLKEHHNHCQSGLISLIHGQNIETNSPCNTHGLQLIIGVAFLSCAIPYLHTSKIDGLFSVSRVVVLHAAKLHYAVPFHLIFPYTSLHIIYIYILKWVLSEKRAP